MSEWPHRCVDTPSAPASLRDHPACHLTVQGKLQRITCTCCTPDPRAPGGVTVLRISSTNADLNLTICCSFPCDQGFCEHLHVMLSWVCVCSEARPICVWPSPVTIVRPCWICSVCSVNTTAHVYHVQTVCNRPWVRL